MRRLGAGEVISPAVSGRVLDWLAADTDTSLVADALLLDPLAHVEPEYQGMVLRHKTGSTSFARADIGHLAGPAASVAYAVADELGFAKDDVVWVRTSFEAAIAPGPKGFDFNIQQYTITDERKQAVDFSSPYYQASQAVVAIEGGKADGVDTLAGLKDLLLGAMSGSTSATTIEKAVQPNVAPQLYNSNEDAVAALKANQIDAIVLDLPTAYYATGVYIENSFIVGELPAAGIPDEWGLLLSKNSPLTAKVTAAVDALRDSGKLAEITDEWLGSGQGVTLLK